MTRSEARVRLVEVFEREARGEVLDVQEVHGEEVWRQEVDRVVVLAGGRSVVALVRPGSVVL